LNIHFAEYPDIHTGKTVIVAYAKVGNRDIQERSYISFENYKQDYIDATYQRLKDDVRRRVLNEMRVQQRHDGQFTRASTLTWRAHPQIEDIVSVQPLQQSGTPEYYIKYRKTDCHKVDWKKEGF
tara:strand:- start:158 stop:532 length:375 start_codon:yes stop_codon:yes gene_type:complete